MGNFQSVEQTKFPLKIRNTKKYGCICDIPDQRDILTDFPSTIEYYKSADLRKTNFLPEITNQGEIGSSVAHALLAAYIFGLKKEGKEEIEKLSAQFIYYNQRVLSNTVESDSGSSIRDGIKVLERLGVCHEVLYPYSLDFFKERPIDEAYLNAYAIKQHIQYRRVRILHEDIFKSISLKFPVIMGFTIYDSFEHPDVTRSGIMPMPKPGEKIVGHHCTLIIGYDIEKKYFLCRNNMGLNYGQSGCFWMPFYFVNPRNCSDLWIISSGYNNKPVAKLTANVSQVKKQIQTKEKIPEKLVEKSIEKHDFKDDVSEHESINEDEETII